MKILYFAAIRDKAGVASEDVSPPGDILTLWALIDWLRARGGGPASALADLGTVRIAVDQEYVPLDSRDDDHPVGPTSEVAFFPPVTGG